MSNYTKSTNFATKDSLPSGDALKIVKGTEIDTEFNNIATAIATKADSASPTFTGSPVLPTGATGVTQSAGNNSTALATTAYADAAITAERTATATLTNKSLTSPTLTGTPVAPTASVNTNTTQVATTAFVVAQIADDAPTKTGGNASGTWAIDISGNAATASNAIGVSQTWQVVTGSRALGTTYTNSTGRSIGVSVTATCNTSGSLDLQLTVGGVLVGRQYQVPPGGFTAVGTVYAVVPTGTTYSCTAAGAVSFTWQELR